MMYSSVVLAIGLLALLAKGDYPICTDQNCKHCPVGLSSRGTGYPHCVYYDSRVVTANGHYKHDQTFWDFKPPAGNCIAVKSFDKTPTKNCGSTPIGCAGTKECLQIDLQLFQNYFVVEGAKGPDNCVKIGCANGSKRALRSASDIDTNSGIFSNVLQHKNGTVIMPAGVISRETGEDVMHEFLEDFGLTRPIKSRSNSVKQMDNIPSLQADRSCKKFVTRHPGGYTMAASSSQLVTSSVSGPGTIQHTVSTTVEFSSTVEAGLTFDIFSAGVSFTTSRSHTMQDTYSVKVPKGETGSVYFTPTLICADGKLHCDDGVVRKATGCTAFLPNGKGGPNAGTYAFVSN